LPIDFIPFNTPNSSDRELDYLRSAITSRHLSGDGSFTKKCHAWIEENTLCKKALLTQSCTSALELAALLVDIKPGDEIIMPSYTFVSTANAFVLRGGIPVFVDIREDCLNIDVSLIEPAITSRTKAIVPVHYAGIACDMDPIMQLAEKYGLVVIEDAAQGLMATYRDKPLGSIGSLGTYSFHETKNIISGEGGALLINQADMIANAEIIREKGTNRSRFLRGQVDKYTWESIGSSFLPSELTAAFLYAQLERADEITKLRLAKWQAYHERLAGLEESGVLRRPLVPEYCRHNGHIYYVILEREASRQDVLDKLISDGVQAVFHYVPLHSSPAGKRYGRTHGELVVTECSANRLIRLPLWSTISLETIDRVVTALEDALSHKSARD
jgi:dTDP-4-amino-4,6-dideoxygalactose transaminase